MQTTKVSQERTGKEFIQGNQQVKECNMKRKMRDILSTVQDITENAQLIQECSRIIMENICLRQIKESWKDYSKTLLKRLYNDKQF